MENQEPNEDRSQDDPHPEVGPSVYQSRHSIDSDPDEAPHTSSLSTGCIRPAVKFFVSGLSFPVSIPLFRIRSCHLDAEYLMAWVCPMH